MNTFFNKLLLLVSCAFLFLASAAHGATAPAVKTKDAAGQQRWTAPDFASVPKSKFSSQGTNPFYPQAKQVAAPLVQTQDQPRIETEVFVLNGITGPPVRSAMINGQTFLAGEKSEIRLSSGSKMEVRCVEISDTSAVIEVGGVRRELRLRTGI